MARGVWGERFWVGAVGVQGLLSESVGERDTPKLLTLPERPCVWGLGFGGWVSGLGVWGFGFGVWD